VEVRGTIAPAIEVHSADTAEREDSSFDVGYDARELARRGFGEVFEGINVCGAGEPDRSEKTPSDRWVQ
jgi:hypothetical protein